MLLPRLYAILDAPLAEARGLPVEAVFDIWIAAGIRLIQLRAKTWPSGRLLTLADSLAIHARAAGVMFIVNDRPDVARLAGADGVHLGQDDLTPLDTRALLPLPACIGLSTHTDDQLRVALEQPIDYVASGPVFATSSKERPDPVIGLDGVQRSARMTRARSMPLVAIGGIRLEDMGAVLDAGADSVAVISGLLGDGLAERARAYVAAAGG